MNEHCLFAWWRVPIHLHLRFKELLQELLSEGYLVGSRDRLIAARLKGYTSVPPTEVADLRLLCRVLGRREFISEVKQRFEPRLTIVD